MEIGIVAPATIDSGRNVPRTHMWSFERSYLQKTYTCLTRRDRLIKLSNFYMTFDPFRYRLLNCFR